MRNTTKLKHILTKYSLGVDADEEGFFKITMVDKHHHNNLHTVEGKSWSVAISKAYSVFLKEIK